MKLVVTDGATLSGGGVSLDIFSQFGEVQIYDLTAPEQLAERVGDADGILCNKTPIPAELFDRCPKLRYVGECATGYNNIDIAAAKAHGVTVCNVAGYSTDAVAQHTFALILHHYSRVAQYDAAVRQGAWKQAKTFCIMPYPMQELAGKMLAVVGYGSIGKKVAAIGAAFGMRLCIATRTKPQNCPYPLVSLDEAFRHSHPAHAPDRTDRRHGQCPATEYHEALGSAGEYRTGRTDRRSRPGTGSAKGRDRRCRTGRADGRTHGRYAAVRAGKLHADTPCGMDTAGNQTAAAGTGGGKFTVLARRNAAECDYCTIRRKTKMIDVSSKKRIVLKLGTSTLTHKTGKLNIRRMTNLVRILSDLHNAGKELLLVSSGAVGMGVGKLNLPERPKDTPSKQAAAAVGQCELMHIYDDMFSKYNVTVAQILLTRATLTNERLPHVQNTIGRLLEMGVIPIVNENDTVAIDELELEIGENDSLSATVAAAVGADLLIILSDINGLYSADPRTDTNAQVIREVRKIDAHIEQMAGGAGSALGSGGMATKINAAKIATEAGVDMVIMNGRDPEQLYALFDGEPIGTHFLAE